jgi:hypothetical protein
MATPEKIGASPAANNMNVDYVITFSFANIGELRLAGPLAVLTGIQTRQQLLPNSRSSSKPWRALACPRSSALARTRRFWCLFELARRNTSGLKFTGRGMYLMSQELSYANYAASTTGSMASAPNPQTKTCPTP